MFFIKGGSEHTSVHASWVHFLLTPSHKFRKQLLQGSSEPLFLQKLKRGSSAGRATTNARLLPLLLLLDFLTLGHLFSLSGLSVCRTKPSSLMGLSFWSLLPSQARDAASSLHSGASEYREHPNLRFNAPPGPQWITDDFSLMTRVIYPCFFSLSSASWTQGLQGIQAAVIVYTSMGFLPHPLAQVHTPLGMGSLTQLQGQEEVSHG